MILLMLACNGEVADTGNDGADQDNDGFVLSEDCHDRNPEINPGATEVCDGVDNDCDGLVDEEVTVSVFEDADGDGFGAAVLAEACPEDGVEVDGDCDDSDAEVHPDADEVCSDGLDNDCDPSTACSLSGALTEATASWAGSEAGDGLGGPIRGVGDLNGDGAEEVAVSAPGADGAGEDAGAITLFEGPLSGPQDAGSAIIHGLEAGDQLLGVWGLGDGQLAVSSRKAAGGAGTTWVLEGPLSGDVDLALFPRLVGETLNQGSGVLAPAWDSNGDGLMDLAVSAPKASRAWLVYGPFTGVSSLADADAIIEGDDGAEQIGGGITSTDLTGDGISDLVLGAPYRGGSGEVLFFTGPLTGTMGPEAATATRTGVVDDEAGWALSPARDHDGDGYGDLWVSATRNDAGAANAGAVYLVRGPVTGSSKLGEGAVAVLGTEAGTGMAPNHGDGDVDGDGNPDLVLGCRACEGGDGAAWLFHGPLTGVLSTDDADAWVETDGAGVGAPVNLADVDGDGLSDWLVGGRDSGAEGQGAAWLYAGVGL